MKGWRLVAFCLGLFSWDMAAGAVSVDHLRTETAYVLDLESPNGTGAEVHVPRIGIGENEVHEVSVNGTVVWRPGSVYQLPGVTVVGPVGDRIVFEVAAGSWRFLARSEPGHLVHRLWSMEKLGGSLWKRTRNNAHGVALYL